MEESFLVLALKTNANINDSHIKAMEKYLYTYNDCGYRGNEQRTKRICCAALL